VTLELTPEQKRQLRNEFRKFQLSLGKRAVSDDEWVAHLERIGFFQGGRPQAPGEGFFDGGLALDLVRAQYLLVDGRTDVGEEELQLKAKTVGGLSPLLAANPEDAAVALTKVSGCSLEMARLFIDTARAYEANRNNVRPFRPKDPRQA
jgi:hypothetical protein